MTEYVIYGKHSCPECDKAEGLLKMKGYPYKKLMHGVDYDTEELWNVAGEPVRTLPFIVKKSDEGSVERIGPVQSLVASFRV